MWGQGAWYARVCCADEETGSVVSSRVGLLQNSPLQKEATTFLNFPRTSHNTRRPTPRARTTVDRVSAIVYTVCVPTSPDAEGVSPPTKAPPAKQTLVFEGFPDGTETAWFTSSPPAATPTKKTMAPPGTPVNLTDSDTESASESDDRVVVNNNARKPREVIETLLNEDFPNEGFGKGEQIGVTKASTQKQKPAPPVNTPNDPAVWVDSDDETVALDPEVVGTQNKSVLKRQATRKSVGTGFEKRSEDDKLVPPATFPPGKRRATVSVNDLAKDPCAFRPAKKARVKGTKGKSMTGLKAKSKPTLTPTGMGKGKRRLSAPAVSARVARSAATGTQTRSIPPSTAPDPAQGRPVLRSRKSADPENSLEELGAAMLKAKREGKSIAEQCAAMRAEDTAALEKDSSKKEPVTPQTFAGASPGVPSGGSPGATMALASLAKSKSFKTRRTTVSPPPPPPPPVSVPMVAETPPQTPPQISAAKAALRHAKEQLDLGRITAKDYNTMKYQCLHLILLG